MADRAPHACRLGKGRLVKGRVVFLALLFLTPLTERPPWKAAWHKERMHTGIPDSATYPAPWNQADQFITLSLPFSWLRDGARQCHLSLVSPRGAKWRPIVKSLDLVGLLLGTEPRLLLVPEVLAGDGPEELFVVERVVVTRSSSPGRWIIRGQEAWPAWLSG